MSTNRFSLTIYNVIVTAIITFKRVVVTNYQFVSINVATVVVKVNGYRYVLFNISTCYQDKRNFTNSSVYTLNVDESTSRSIECWWSSAILLALTKMIKKDKKMQKKKNKTWKKYRASLSSKLSRICNDTAESGRRPMRESEKRFDESHWRFKDSRLIKFRWSFSIMSCHEYKLIVRIYVVELLFSNNI